MNTDDNLKQNNDKFMLIEFLFIYLFYCHSKSTKLIKLNLQIYFIIFYSNLFIFFFRYFFHQTKSLKETFKRRCVTVSHT